MRNFKMETQVCGKVGHPKYFNKKERNFISNYTVDSKHIGLPLTKRHLKDDIKHVIIKKRRTNCPFKDQKPGRNWFKNMREEFKDEFPVYSDDEKLPHENDQIDLRQWCQQKRKHILQFNDSKMLDSRERVFVVEMEKYHFDATDKNKCVRIVICYSSGGFVLNPLFINSGYFHQNTMRRHIGRITFLWSDPKEVDRDILLFMILDLKHFMKEEHVSGPVILWVTPALFPSHSLVSWMAARKNGIVLEVLPSHLYDSYRLTNRGVFDKLIPALDKEIEKRSFAATFTGSYHAFCDLFWDVWANIGMCSHLTKSCQAYKLCHLKRKRRVQNREQGNDEEVDARIEAVKAKYTTFKFPFALPPFTHLRSVKIDVPTARDNSQCADGSTSSQANIHRILANVSSQKSDLSPFDTGVHAHKTVPGIAPPINPYAIEKRSKLSSPQKNTLSGQVHGDTGNEHKSEVQVVCVTQSQVESGGATSSRTRKNVNSQIFQYAYTPDGLHICNMPNNQQMIPTALIKVERQDSRYGVRKTKTTRKLNVALKSEDSTDSD